MAEKIGLRHLSRRLAALLATVLAVHLMLQPGPAAYAQTNVVIRLSPATTVVNAGSVWTTTIVLDAGTQPVNGVDACLTFDPRYLVVVDAAGQPVSSNALIPGSALPVIIMNQADNAQGHIVYSAGLLSGSVTGQITVATIRFKAKATPPLGGTSVVFLREPPCETLVAAPGGISVLGVAEGATIYSNTVVLPLAQGWNLISFPYPPSNPTLPAPLSSIAGRYTLMYGYDPTTLASPWRIYRPTLNYGNTLSTVTLQAGYWIKTTSPVTLTYTAPFPTTTDIPLQVGWNLIGFPSHRTQSITDALSSLAGKFDAVYAYDASDSVSPWRAYWPGPPERGDLWHLTPGRGYWIHITSPTTLRVVD